MSRKEEGVKIRMTELLKLFVPEELFGDLVELARRKSVSVEDYALSVLAEHVTKIAEAENAAAEEGAEGPGRDPA